MPIRIFLQGRNFDSETVRLMGLAFESCRVALDVADRDDPINQLIADKVIALAQQGERSSERICEKVLNDFSQHPPFE